MIKENLGLRCHNPLNIRYTGTPWKGLDAQCPAKHGFCCFVSLGYGLRAAYVVLHTYMAKYGLCTVSQIVNRWAPPSENNTAAYVRAVARQMGVDETRTRLSANHLLALVAAMAKQETGLRLNEEEIKKMMEGVAGR